MIRYFVASTVPERRLKPIKCSLISLVCYIFVVLGCLLVLNDSYAFRTGDKVVVQNTFLDGLEVWNIPNLRPDIVYDGTRGTILSEPLVPTGNSFKVSWEVSPGTLTTGWSTAEKDGCKVIGTAEEAEQRDKIVAKLFQMSLDKDNTGLHRVDRYTNHEYNGYGCNLTWEENGKLVITAVTQVGMYKLTPSLIPLEMSVFIH